MNVKKVTKRAVARYLNGEVTELAELERIENALAEDPQVQQWYEELDLESLLPDEPEAPTEVASPGQTRELLDQLRRAELWRLELKQPLSGLVEMGSEAEGVLIRAERWEEKSLPCRVRLTAGEPASFDIQLDGRPWPYGYTPLQLLVGPISPAVLGGAEEPIDAELSVVSLPALRRRLGHRSRRGTEAGSGALDTSTSKPLGDLSADDRTPLDQVSPATGRCGTFAWKIQEDHGCRVEIETPAVAGREEQLVVVELTYWRKDEPNLTVLRRVVRLQTGSRPTTWRGNASFGPLRDARDPDVGVRIAPLTEKDLYLLSPGNVTQLLAAKEAVGIALIAREKETSFTFQVRWDNQRTLTGNADASKHLHLLVARPSEEE